MLTKTAQQGFTKTTFPERVEGNLKTNKLLKMRISTFKKWKLLAKLEKKNAIILLFDLLFKSEPNFTANH